MIKQEEIPEIFQRNENHNPERERRRVTSGVRGRPLGGRVVRLRPQDSALPRRPPVPPAPQSPGIFRLIDWDCCRGYIAFGGGRGGAFQRCREWLRVLIDSQENTGSTGQKRTPSFFFSGFSVLSSSQACTYNPNSYYPRRLGLAQLTRIT